MCTRLLIDTITMKYPACRLAYAPQPMDLTDRQDVDMLTVVFENGILLELRSEGESHDALNTLRHLLKNPGCCRPIQLDEQEKELLWFYHEGDECYAQYANGVPFAVVMIDPIPHPEKFE